MIAANIEHSNVEIYKKLNKYFERAFEETKRLMSEDIADGSYKFDEDAFYVNVFTYQTKKEADCCFEKHGKYIDIQVVLDGEEIIGFESEDKLSKTVDELAQKDYMLFSLNKEYDKSKLLLHNGKSDIPLFLTASANPYQLLKDGSLILYLLNLPVLSVIAI